MASKQVVIALDQITGLLHGHRGRLKPRFGNSLRHPTGVAIMTLAELAQHLTREEMAAFGMWPDPSEHDELYSDDYGISEEMS